MGFLQCLLQVLPVCLGTVHNKVQVKLPWGGCEELEHPCVASNLMHKYPEHIVVQCLMMPSGTVNITIIAPTQKLQVGMPYILYPKLEMREENDANQVHIPGTTKQLNVFHHSTSPKNCQRKKCVPFETIIEGCRPAINDNTLRNRPGPVLASGLTTYSSI
jgi:hypothetical protein